MAKAAGLMAGAQVLGQYFGRRQQQKDQSKQRQFAVAMAKWQREQDLEMWHKKNEYNTPQAQMERLREAGLNPALMYGQGTTGTADSMPTQSVPQGQFDVQQLFDPASTLQEYQNMAMNRATLDLQVEKLNTQDAMSSLKWAHHQGVISENSVKRLEQIIAEQMMFQGDDDGHRKKIDYDKIRELTSIRWDAKKAQEMIRILDADIRKWEKSLTDEGVAPGDHLGIRAIINFLQILGIAPSKLMQKHSQ